MVNSRQKGKRGEREAAALLRSHGFEEARRSVQYSGREGTADLAGTLGYHVEVKNTGRCALPAWLEQVDRDRGQKPFLILWKQPGGRWLAIGDAKDVLPALSKKANDGNC